MARVSVREQLVEAATTRFHEDGFNGCSVQDITDLAAVPKGSFYNHFASKEALGAEIVRLYSEARQVEMLSDSSVPPIPRLRGHFAFLAAAVEADDFRRGCMLGNFGTELSGQSELVRAQVQTALDAWSMRVSDVLREARAAGDLTIALDDAALGRFVVGAWQGAVLRAKVARGRAPLDDFFTVLTSMLV